MDREGPSCIWRPHNKTLNLLCISHLLWALPAAVTFLKHTFDYIATVWKAFNSSLVHKHQAKLWSGVWSGCSGTWDLVTFLVSSPTIFCVGVYIHTTWHPQLVPSHPGTNSHRHLLFFSSWTDTWNLPIFLGLVQVPFFSMKLFWELIAPKSSFPV